jgi:hypothetical protein
MTFRDSIVKLDIDHGGPRSLALLHHRLIRAGYRSVRWISYQRSPSGTGWHVMVLPVPAPRSAVEVVALQLLLGSDPEREAAVLHRARQYARTPAFARGWFNVLYTHHPARSRRLRVRH